MVPTNRNTDLIDLVSYTLDNDFVESVKEICNIIGISYYYDFSENIPDSFKILRMLNDMYKPDDIKENQVVKPIDCKVLNYYKPYLNDMFACDGISYSTQKEFGIGYDEQSNRITIPIYSETGDLLGVKGRLFKKELNPNDIKYLYLEPIPKGRTLYGLNKTMPYIKKSNEVYVFESEKGVMQSFSYGYCNAVATGGKNISSIQIDMLIRIGAKIIICYDKDVEQSEIEKLASKFIDGVPIYYMYDMDNKLKDKQSPTDNLAVWEYMIKNNIYRMR